jgi:RNA polymerase-binding transcription factor DksA
MLVRLREQVARQVSSLSDDSLNRVDDTPMEDRTDDFDREFALNLASTGHDALFEIDDALRRLQEGTYGKCDACGVLIEKPRLKALPFAKLCLKCQSDVEKGRAKFRPFGSTISPATERSSEAPAPEEEETE